MALSPNVVVVAPGELITAAHLNNVRANLDRLDTTKVTDTGDTMSGTLIVGGNPVTPSPGTMITETGGIQSARSIVNAANLALNRHGAANPVGQPFVVFTLNPALTSMGSIAVGAGATVVYNTTSDPRLKHRDGDAADAADLAQAIGRAAYRGRWRDPETGEPGGDEWVLLNSTDIEAHASWAVTGTADAVDDAGAIVPQQVDYPGLVPLLFAALAQALDRIETLEGGSP